jgi:hypothetical protein
MVHYRGGRAAVDLKSPEHNPESVLFQRLREELREFFILPS